MLTRRAFLGAASAAAAGRIHAQARRPPNIILILADDLGWGDLGCYGSPDIRTPHLDRMAREGVRFTHFYAQPLCGPSRSALMTGCYPVRNSLMFNHLPKAKTGIHPDEVTIPELLKTRGYATAMAGKWHLGDAPPFLPTRHGFDSWLGLPYSNDMWPFHPKIQKPRIPSAQGDIARARAEAHGYEGRGQVYPPDWFPDLPLMRNEEVIELNPEQNRLTQRYTETALDFINENRGRPFFFYLAHAMPHAPLFPARAFEGRSRRGRYGDVVEELDDSAGRIRARVQELGLENETLIIFTSDNGPWKPYGIDAGSAGPLRGAKGTHWEGGIRVPFIASLPGRIPFGLQSSEVAASIDLLPTFASLAGAPMPRDRIIDGRMIYRLMTQKGATSPHDAFYYYAAPTNYLAADGRPGNRQNLVAVRDRQWKLHLEAAPGGAKGALYDVHADPGEENDVAARNPDVVNRLRTLGESFNAKLSTEIRPPGRIEG
jgi:arylsulfatase A-like enzyme